MKIFRCAILACLVAFSTRANAADGEYRVPYRLTDSSHIVVRIKVNGEGPFNVLVDSGAPALFLDPSVSRYLGLQVSGQGWATINRLEIEGGPTIEKYEAKVQEMMQVTGMNKRNLCGVRLDGSMGYTALANFKMEIDFTKPYMTWTRLNLARGPVCFGSNPNPQMRTVNPPALPTVPRLKNPNKVFTDMRDPQPPKPGYIGIEFDPDVPPLKIAAVIKGSPAEAAGLKQGDVIVEFGSRAVQFPEDVTRASSAVTAGSSVTLKIQRGGQTMTINVTAGSAL